MSLAQRIVLLGCINVRESHACSSWGGGVNQRQYGQILAARMLEIIASCHSVSVTEEKDVSRGKEGSVVMGVLLGAVGSF